MNTRVHIVVSVAALVTGLAGAVLYMLLTGERGGARFVGWAVMIVAISYPSLLISVRSERQGRCVAWLRRIAMRSR